MKKTLLLINPVSRSHPGLSASRSKYPPLGLGIVASLTPNDWDIILIDENYDEFTFTEADLVAVTSYTSNICRAYEISLQYKIKGIPVVIGGIHASNMPDEAISFATTVAIGEAEGVWPQILEDFAKGNLQQFYQRTNKKYAPIYPVKHELFSEKYEWSSIQTSRGCPFSCEFCTVSNFYGKHVRMRPPEAVVAEIKTMTKDFFWIVDDNFFGNNRKQRRWAKEVCELIIKNNINKKWMCFATVDSVQDEEMLEIASKSGCCMAFLGIETESDEQLVGIDKLNNKPTTYLEAYEKMHRYGIAVLGGLILGNDDDTLETIQNRIDYILSSPIDCYWLTVMTPLPGSRLYQRLLEEKRLLYTNFPSDWNKYTWANLVHIPLNLQNEDLNDVIDNAYKQVYSFKTIKKKYKQTLERTKKQHLAYISYLTNKDSSVVFLPKDK